jgi:hypothetical protein
MRYILSSCLLLTLVAGTALAQSGDQSATSGANDNRSATASQAAPVSDATPRNDHNWGWIGLLGLAG